MGFFRLKFRKILLTFASIKLFHAVVRQIAGTGAGPAKMGCAAPQFAKHVKVLAART